MAIQEQLRRLLSFFILLFVIVSGFLVYWQAVWPVKQTTQYNAYRQCIASEQPVRGRIFDRNGVLLAWSEPDPNSFCGWRRRYATHDYTAAQSPTGQPLQGHPSISSFIGYFSYVYGSTGLEHYYDDQLTGNVLNADPNATVQQIWNQTLHQQIHGQDIYLGIDIRIQDDVDKNYKSPVTGTVCPDSDKGSIIVQDPRNGQILAMLSRPYYDADKIGDPTPAADNPKVSVGQEFWSQINTDPNSPLLNRPLQGQYVPGSSFKTMSLIAGIDSGAFTINSTFTKDEATTYTVNGFKINSNNLADYPQGLSDSSFPLPLGHAYAYSDNVVFARVGTTMGKDTFLNYAKNFYMSTPDYHQNLPVDTFPPAVSKVYSSPTMPPELLAQTAYGQGELFLTPMTMSMLVGAVAADGQLFAPRFLLKSVTYDTRNPTDVAKSDPNNDPVLLTQQPIFSAQTALQVRQAMRDVVVYGSVGASGGQIAAVQNLSTTTNGKNTPLTIGGKTGTAQLGSGNPHAWFISMAPDNGYGGPGARMTVVVMKERGGEGACQAPVAGKIYQDNLPLFGN